MRPPRLRLRTLMIAVAIASLMMWAEVWTERHRKWVRDAPLFVRGHRAGARIFRNQANMAGAPAARELSLGRVFHHEAMAEKYSRVALRPWMPIWPDPPVPE